MAAQRRSATKQRRRGSGAARQVEPAPAATQAAPAPEPKKQTPPARAAAPKQQAAPARVSKFRTTYENLRKAMQNTISEIKKVSWPDSETTRKLTALVIAMSTVLGLLLGGIDFLLLKLFETF